MPPSRLLRHSRLLRAGLDRVAIMTRGQVVYEGTPDALASDAAVALTYLGV